MPLPTTRLGWVFILSSPVWILAMLLGAPQVVGIGVVALVLVVAAVDVAALPSRRRVEVTREVPASIGVGDIVQATYRIAVEWPGAVHGALYDELPRGVRRETPMPQAFVARRAAPATLAVDLQGRERGEWPLGRMAVRLRGPLGLMARTYRWRPQEHVLVAPSIANVRRYRLLAMQHRLRDAGVRVLRRRGEGTSFAGLREYAVGDDPRLVDWKASARRQTLITREFSVEQGQTVHDRDRLWPPHDAVGGRSPAIRVRVVVGTGVGGHRA